MANSRSTELDEIDRIILSILADNPRTPYSDIADEVNRRGYEKSGEGIRYRVQKLFEATSTFFMLNPESHDWHVLRLAISVDDSTDAKPDVMGELQEMPFWFLSSGVGSFDIYANVLATTLGEVDDYIAAVRSIEEVDHVDFFLETHRVTDATKYFPPENDE
ncbi:MAG: Lrp/AsnC family transcriptional regulator [Haloarculaceae archaeon]